MSKRKHLIYGAITLIVIVISSVFCNNMYSINRMQKSQIIKENQAKWNLIYEMTQEIETYFVKSDDWTKVDQFWVYVNGVTHYDGMKTLEPQFTSHFLAVHYDRLFSSLCVDDECLIGYEEEGFQIFSDMNKELKQISKSVLEKIDRGENFLDPESKEYQETSKELQEFCQKYEEAINELYEKAAEEHN